MDKESVVTMQMLGVTGEVEILLAIKASPVCDALPVLSEKVVPAIDIVGE